MAGLSQVEQSTMSKNDRSSWLAESLRLTAFMPAEPDQADLSGSWKALVGDEPDDVELKPKEHVLQESGSFHEATLIFRHIPHRTDWIVRSSQISLDTCDTIGKFVDETPVFVRLMKKWLAASPEIKRLAFGAVLIDPVRDHDEGCTKVSGYLPFKVDLRSRNFMYQINRRRDSRLGVAGLAINRLSKWSCIELQIAQFMVGKKPEMVKSDSPSPVAVRLEVDINTVPEYPESLDPGTLIDLFDECVNLGREIAEKGDIP